MKFTNIKIVGALTVINLKVQDASSSDSYILKDFSGLGPVERDFFSSPNSEGGGHYQGRRPHERELVFLIKLQPNYSIGQTAESLRKHLNLLYARQNISIQLWDGIAMVGNVKGILKNLEPGLTSSEPQVQLTFMCEDPYIEGSNVFLNLDGSSPKTDLQTPYDGTAPGWFTTNIKVLSSCSWVKLEAWSGKTLYMYASFQANDKITISTAPDWKTVYYTRSGDIYSLLNGLILGPSDDRTWPYLIPAYDNEFSITSSAGSSAVEWDNFSYTNQYEGV